MKKKEKKENRLQTPKGMKDIFHDEYYRRQGFFEKAQEVSVYYGFDPIETPIMEYQNIFIKGIGAGTDIVDKEIYSLKTKGGDRLALRPEYTAAIMRAYIEHGMQAKPQPIYLYSYGPLFRHERPQAGRFRQLHQFNLEILGSEKSILDAVIIYVSFIILKESGIENPKIKINSLGDRESREEFTKALISFYKKNKNKISPKDKKRLKTNPLRILDSKEINTIEVNRDAPASISYLNSASKKHFKQVLEYLDGANIDYEIDNTLVRGLDYYAHTVFEFFFEDEEDKSKKPMALGGGGRYNTLAETLGHKRNVPAVGAALGVERILKISKNKFNPKIIKKVKVFFVQIGTEAKLKSFKIIEILRNKKIPVKHSLSKDNLSTQLGTAKKLKIPYTIIFGQKEALDETVIVRNMKKRSQKTVGIEKLADYIKKLK